MKFTFSTDDTAEAVKVLEALGVAVQKDYLSKPDSPRAAARQEDARDLPQAPPSDDPWGEDTPSQPAQTRSQPQQASESDRNQAGGVPRTGSFNVDTDNGPRRWTFGKSDAPDCECGNKAALQEGKTNGKLWGRWTCALGYSKDTYKGKCSFAQFASSKKN